MKRLIIIGARGYGREAYHLASQCEGFNKEWIIKGFLDDKTDAITNYTGYPPIIGPVETYDIQPDDVFICALGDVNQKFSYVRKIKDKGGNFISLIHPTSNIFPNTVNGEGLIVCPYVVISCDIVIGDFVTIQSYSDIGHDVRIGDYCHLNAFSFLGGNVKVGSFTTIHTGAKIIPGIRVGDNVTVGAGSLVIKNINNPCTVFGIPAKPIY